MGNSSTEERTLRLSQLNDLHNQLVNTPQEMFCPALRWALDNLGCPIAYQRFLQDENDALEDKARG